MDTPAVTIPGEGPVVLTAPAGGWTWTAYHQAIEQFTRARGRAPRVVRLHPDTLDQVLRTKAERAEQTIIERVVGILDVEEDRLNQRLQQEQRQRVEQSGVEIVAAPDHDRETLELE